MARSKVALVTGSGKRRVGWHVAEALARRGYALALHFRTSALEAQLATEEFRQFGSRVEAFRADLAEEQEVRTLVEETLSAFGRIDVLVNSAGVWQSKRLEDVTAA